VAVTVLVLVEITEMELLPLLTTQACEPSGVTATPIGNEPTGTVAATVLVAGSTTENRVAAQVGDVHVAGGSWKVGAEARVSVVSVVWWR
jgi:hypothetical protein